MGIYHLGNMKLPNHKQLETCAISEIQFTVLGFQPTTTHVCNRALGRLAKLANWLSVYLRTKRFSVAPHFSPILGLNQSSIGTILYTLLKWLLQQSSQLLTPVII